MSLLSRFIAIPQIRSVLIAYDQLEVREKIALKCMVIFFAGVFVFYGLWQPSLQFAIESRKSLEANQELLGWMRSTEKQARAAPKGDGGARPTGQLLLTTVSRTAKAAKITYSRLQPEGENGVNVIFESVSFNDLMKWLEQLEAREGMRVRQISIDRQEESGMVNARLILKS